MPDYGPPIINPQGQGLTPALQSAQLLSTLVGVGRQAQAFQSEKQTLQQRRGIAGIDWEKYDDGAGMVSTDKMLGDHELRARAGDQFPDIVQAAAQIRGNQLSNKRTLVGLNNDLRDQFGSVLGALRTDPDVINDTPAGRPKVRAAISQFATAGGPDAAKVAEIFGPVADAAPPGKLLRGISAIQMQAMDASTQANAQAPQLADTGSQLVNTNPLAAGGNLGNSNLPITKQVGPGFSTFSDSAGNQWAVNPQNPKQAVMLGQGENLPPAGTPNAPGEVEASLPNVEAAFRAKYGVSPQGGNIPQEQAAPQNQPAAPSQAQPPSRPPITIPGQAELQGSIDAARAASAQVGVSSNINRRILGLLDKTKTGPATQFVNDIESILPGIPAASAYQELGAFLDRQAAQAAHTMGLPDTNLGIETAKKFTGDTSYNNKVIRDKTNFVESLNTAAATYRAGMERVLGSPNAPNYGAYQKYRADWAKNFDPEIFALENAYKNNDTEERDRVVANIGKKNMPELFAKRKALMGLVTGP